MSDQQTNTVYTATMTQSLKKAKYHLRGTSICIALISLWLLVATVYCSIDPELSTKYEHPFGPFADTIAAWLIKLFGAASMMIPVSMLWLSVMLWRYYLIKFRPIDPILYFLYVCIVACQLALTLPSQQLFGGPIGGLIGTKIVSILESIAIFPLVQITLTTLMTALFFATAQQFKLFSNQNDNELEEENIQANTKKLQYQNTPVKHLESEQRYIVDHPMLNIAYASNADDDFLEPEMQGAESPYAQRHTYANQSNQAPKHPLQQNYYPSPVVDAIYQASNQILKGVPIAPSPYQHYSYPPQPQVNQPHLQYQPTPVSAYPNQALMPNQPIIPTHSSHASHTTNPSLSARFAQQSSHFANGPISLPAVFEAEKQFIAEPYISMPPVAAPPVEILTRESDILLSFLASLGIQCNISYLFTGPVVHCYQIDVESGFIGPTWQITQYLKQCLQTHYQEKHAVRMFRDLKMPNRYYIEQMVRQTRFPSVKEALQIATDRGTLNDLFLVLGQKSNGEHYSLNLKTLHSLMVIGDEKIERHVGVDQIILNMVYQASPDELRMVILDPLGEDSPYHELPHLYAPIKRTIRNIDEVLSWIHSEIRRRNGIIHRANATSFDDYHSQSQPLQRILFVISDMHILSVQQLEKLNQILTQLESNQSSVGLHMILSTRNINPIDLKLYESCQVRLVLPVINPAISTQLDAEGAETLINERDALITYANTSIEANVTSRIHLWRLTQSTSNQLLKQCIAHAQVEYIIEEESFISTQSSKKSKNPEHQALQR